MIYLVTLVKIISVTEWTEKPDYSKLQNTEGVKKADVLCLFCDGRDLSFQFFWEEESREKLKTQERGNNQYIKIPEKGGNELKSKTGKNIRRFLGIFNCDRKKDIFKNERRLSQICVCW